MKFRKKPVVIEAWDVRQLCRHAANSWENLPQPVIDAYERGGILFIGVAEGLDVLTLEGTMHGDPDDILIRGVKGEFYPCKPDIFEATYEKVE